MTAAMDAFLLQAKGWTRDPVHADVAWSLVPIWKEKEDDYNMWVKAYVITLPDGTHRVEQEVVYYYGIWTGEWKQKVFPPRW